MGKMIYLLSVTKDDLEKLYWDERMSTRDMAKHYGIKDHMVVLRRMKQLGIKTRMNTVKPRYMEVKIKTDGLTPIDLSYLAGIIDGEGCIFVGNTIPNPQLYVLNSSKELIQWVSEIFNSNIKIIEPKINDKYKRNIYYKTMLLRHNDIIAMLKLVLPYLKIKKLKALDSIRHLEEHVNFVNRYEN